MPRPGDEVVLRECWGDRLWSARPAVLVRDEPDLIALYLPPGVPWMRACEPDGARKRLPVGAWGLRDLRWPTSCLRLHEPGADHDLLLFWDPDHTHLRSWYVNLQTPLRRTRLGFDYTDEFLDLVASADLSEWSWEDEDELDEALRLGLLGRARAAALRAEGERVLARMRDRRPPFDGAWLGWRPDPAWPVPRLPPGWDAPPR